MILACGCFDIFTAGHVRHLEAAKQLGSCLVVLVTADEHVNKGPGRPVFPQEVRAEVVDALRCVDYTVINPHPTAVEAIRVLRPQVYVKGQEYEKFADYKMREEGVTVREVGGRVEFLNTKELHTSDALKKLYEQQMENREPIFAHWNGQEFVPQKFNPDCSDFMDDPEVEILEVNTLGREPVVGERFFAFGRRKEQP